MIFTGSRAGVAAGAVGLAVVGLLLAVSSRRAKTALSGLTVAFALAVAFAVTVGRDALERLLSTSLYDVGARDHARS